MVYFVAECIAFKISDLKWTSLKEILVMVL